MPRYLATAATDNHLSALAWMRERDDPFWVTTTDATVADVRASTADHDVVEHDFQPGMVHDSLADLPPTASDVDTSVVLDETGIWINDKQFWLFAAIDPSTAESWLQVFGVHHNMCF